MRLYHPASMVMLTSLALTACSDLGQAFAQDKGIVTITNASAYPLTKVNVRYKNANKVESIGNLAPNSAYHYQINYSDSEDSIYLTYTDAKQKQHTTLVVPYAAKYDKQHYTLTIH